MSALAQDLQHAFRHLRSRPGFTSGVVLTLSMGIGLNAAVFTAVDAALLRSLPYAEPERLVDVFQTRGDMLRKPLAWLTVLPALIVSGLMLGALWLFLSVYIRQVENFAGAMNFVMFPMFFFSSALYPLWRLREGGSELIYWVSLLNPFTHAVEMIRFALYGMFEPVAAAVVTLATVVFFLLATIGYDPQRGMIRRTAQPV